jgi:hypothetical protein
LRRTRRGNKSTGRPCVAWRSIRRTHKPAWQKTRPTWPPLTRRSGPLKRRQVGGSPLLNPPVAVVPPLCSFGCVLCVVIGSDSVVGVWRCGVWGSSSPWLHPLSHQRVPVFVVCTVTLQYDELSAGIGELYDNAKVGCPTPTACCWQGQWPALRPLLLARRRYNPWNLYILYHPLSPPCVPSPPSRWSMERAFPSSFSPSITTRCSRSHRMGSQPRPSDPSDAAGDTCVFHHTAKPLPLAPSPPLVACGRAPVNMNLGQCVRPLEGILHSQRSRREAGGGGGSTEGIRKYGPRQKGEERRRDETKGFQGESLPAG